MIKVRRKGSVWLKYLEMIVEIAGNESGHVHGKKEICHEKSPEGVCLGQVNEACTDEIINLEHDDSQTKDAN